MKLLATKYLNDSLILRCWREHAIGSSMWRTLFKRTGVPSQLDVLRSGSPEASSTKESLARLSTSLDTSQSRLSVRNSNLQRAWLALASDLKSRLRRGERPALLAGHVLTQVFEKPSLRTRVSFEAAVAHTAVEMATDINDPVFARAMAERLDGLYRSWAATPRTAEAGAGR